MYYQSYEDYMRAVLGYPLMENPNTYEIDYLEDRTSHIKPYKNTKELEDCYPEIYKILNPIVCDVCDKYNNTTITKDLIESMTEEVYQKIEINSEIAIKINIDNNISDREVNANNNKINNIKMNQIRNNNNESIKRNQEIENRQRRPNNPFLRDLIRILILNRLLGGFSEGRPPRPRPPFPHGGPIPSRPQIRDYDDYFKF